ncbi:MAG: hypothetical protein IKJ56_04585 [Bacteroidales bacterium]|nr:hypothetical protein [Bacteroidales bacterium]
MLEISDILVAVENKEHFVLDTFVRRGNFIRDTSGRILRYVGGFSAVFPVDVDGEKWAFRCWHANMGNVRRRFEKNSKAINASGLPFLCDFNYVDEGIIVNGLIYPTTRMRWVDGMTIKDFVCANKEDKEKLLLLASNFLTMCKEMHTNKLAHGDLQHGNIIVNDNSDVFLVDYDSFYCQDLEGEPDIITGLRDYQHPNRVDCKIATAKLDYFSELVIYLSIVGIANNPEFVDKYQVKDTDRMLFSVSDFVDIRNSEIYEDLSSLGGEISQLLEILELYLSKNSILDLEPFDVILDRMNVCFEVSSSKIRKGKESAKLSWNVKGAESISIAENGTLLKANLEPNGSIDVKPKQTTQYTLAVTYPGNREVVMPIVLSVFDEAVIDFSSDKQNVFPTVPFTLSWNVKNANRVELEGEQVDCKGHKFFADGVNEEIVYKLSVTDEFGTCDKEVTIKMLPLPVITTLMAPAPKIEKTVNVHVVVPQYKAEVNIPDIEIKEVNLSAPFNLSLEGMEVEIKNPEIVEPKFELESPQESRLNKVRTLFNKARAFVFTKDYERINKSKSVIQKQ